MYETTVLKVMKSGKSSSRPTSFALAGDLDFLQVVWGRAPLNPAGMFRQQKRRETVRGRWSSQQRLSTLARSLDVTTVWVMTAEGEALWTAAGLPLRYTLHEAGRVVRGVAERLSGTCWGPVAGTEQGTAAKTGPEEPRIASVWALPKKRRRRKRRVSFI